MEFVTREEKAQLEAKLEALVSNRKNISQRIAEARELGDLKENAEYHSAREQQGLEEAEIRRLEDRLKHVQIADDVTKVDGMVFVGATVRIREVGTDEDELVRLVGELSDSPDPRVMEATVSSPFGDALLKAHVGETVTIKGPRGPKKFEILELV